MSYSIYNNILLAIILLYLQRFLGFVGRAVGGVGFGAIEALFIPITADIVLLATSLSIKFYLLNVA